MAYHAVRRFGHLMTPPVIIGTTLAIAAGAVAVTFIQARRVPQVSYSSVLRGSITEQVTASGTVAPTESIDLGFERGGTIQSISVGVGDRVYAGETIARLAHADLAAAREQSAANLAEAKAKLALLQSGTRPEQLANDRIAVAQAIQSGFIAADAAVHDDVDAFVADPRSTTPTLYLSVSDSQLKNDFLNGRVQVESAVRSLQNLVPSGSVSSSTDLTIVADQARQDLEAVSSFLDTGNALLNSAVPTNSVTAADIAAYEASVGAARTSVADALQSLDGASGTLRLAEAGFTSQDIASQQAAVAAAQAALDAANANLAQTAIAAPISGTITRQDGNVGQVVSGGQPFISLDSDARFEIKAYVSEADIGTLAVGDSAQATLDAYPDVSFPATVVSIDPAATVQNGVPSYKVTAQFTRLDPRIKAGLTANLVIAAKTADQALLVPSSAIITKGDKTFVLRIKNGIQTLTQVTIGITGSNGQTQIISGLHEGDSVVSFGLDGQTGVL